MAPTEVLDAYRAASSRLQNVEVHIVPSVLHGYMMRTSPAFHQHTRDFSTPRAVAILDRLAGGVPQSLHHVS